MSPEQARGAAIDARSDIFSLGTILYELLARRRAFDGRTIDETLDQVFAAAPKAVDKIRPETPPALAQIVRRAMSREPAERYQKASELRNALAEFVDGSRPAAVDGGAVPLPRPLPAPRRSRGPWLVALALLALLVGGGASMMINREAPAPAPPQADAPVPIIPPMDPPAPPDAAGPAGAAQGDAPKAEQKIAPRKRAEPAPPPPSGDGTVVIAVAPWGEVLVNGAVQGVSPPLTQLTLPAGLHTIEVRNGSSPPFVARVEVRPGEKLQLQHKF
jgi:serine/threonine-protein kinase